MRNPLLAICLTLVVASLVGGCGESHPGAKTGGHTNWLKCQVLADCASDRNAVSCSRDGFCLDAAGARIVARTTAGAGAGGSTPDRDGGTSGGGASGGPAGAGGMSGSGDPTGECAGLPIGCGRTEGNVCCDPYPCDGPNFCMGGLKCCGVDGCRAECDPPSDAGACGMQGDSCLTSACCSGFQCCSGVPIPPDQALCFASTGGAVCPMSDRNIKDGFSSVSPDAVLEGVLALPISRWHYKSESRAIEHIGPMAQDFAATFRVGADDERIFQVDADGVSFAAIQALARKLDLLAANQTRLEQENVELRSALQELRAAFLIPGPKPPASLRR
jgi:hypothetical protein